MTLRTRIAAAASLSVAIAVLASALGLYLAVRSDLRGEVDSALRARAQTFVGPSGRGAGGPGGVGGGEPGGAGHGGSVPGGAGSGAPSGGGADGSPPAGGAGSGGGFPGSVEPAPFGAASGYVQFISPAGAVFVPGGQGSSPRVVPLTASDREIARTGAGTGLSDRSVDGMQLRVLTEGTGSSGAILVAQPLTEVEHELSRLLLLLGLIGAGGIVLAALLGAVVARTALAPVARFTRRTESLSGALDLSQRLEAGGRDELGRLAESFNAMLDALERSVAAQRHLIADASHELRTPISSLRANIQVLGESERLPPEDQQSLRRDIVEELDELTALVADVLELARGADPRGSQDEVRLDEVVTGAVQSARRRGEVRYELDLAPTIVIGQADRISRAVSNLIDNARRWSPPSGTVEVRLKDGVLGVRDHGPGFRETDLAFVFDRFYRAENARSMPGSGLGLAIVRQAAEACGGFAEAENAPGGGALLRVSFGAPVEFDAAGG